MASLCGHAQSCTRLCVDLVAYCTVVNWLTFGFPVTILSNADLSCNKCNAIAKCESNGLDLPVWVNLKSGPLIENNEPNVHGSGKPCCWLLCVCVYMPTKSVIIDTPLLCDRWKRFSSGFAKEKWTPLTLCACRSTHTSVRDARNRIEGFCETNYFAFWFNKSRGIELFCTAVANILIYNTHFHFKIRCERWEK